MNPAIPVKGTKNNITDTKEIIASVFVLFFIYIKYNFKYLQDRTTQLLELPTR
jgi:hypothetical protein